MEPKTYLYRRGNGNDGNYPRALVTLAPDQCPHSALCALVANDYIPGRRVRLHIMRTIQTSGEREYGILADVMEGPDGETEFGAAYITAELQPLSAADVAHYQGQRLAEYARLRDALDRAAWRYYLKRKGA